LPSEKRGLSGVLGESIFEFLTHFIGNILNALTTQLYGVKKGGLGKVAEMNVN